MNKKLLGVVASLSLVLSPLAASASNAPVGLAPKAASFNDTYIVTLKPGSNPIEEARAARAAGGSVPFVYTSALNGFAVKMNLAQIQALAKNPRIQSIEPDQLAKADATQSGATWGLDRIDQESLPLNGTYNYTADGTGVTAYIIDTGILTSHTEFVGRTRTGYTAIADGNGFQDCNGHGTHVAGTVGGTVYGVAKKVALVPVRVLSCSGSGSTSGVIAGVDWVAANATKPAVANMSLGGGFSSALNTAVANLVAKGVPTAVAAGNSNADACTSSPASERSAVTVGATGNTDARASYSNFGTCLDIFAPGSSITSAWYTSTTVTNTISGTSMASPHVAGALALYLSANPSATVVAATSWLTSSASVNKVVSAGTGSPNLLLWARGLGESVTPPPPVAQVSPATDLRVVQSGSTLIFSWNNGTQTLTGIDTYVSVNGRAMQKINSTLLPATTTSITYPAARKTSYAFRVTLRNGDLFADATTPTYRTR